MFYRLVFLFVYCCIHVHGNFSDEQKLHHFILKERGYLKMLRPPGPYKNNTLTLKLGLRLSQILMVSEKYQIVTTNVWLKHEWNDTRLKWDPRAFGNISYTHIPSEDLWIPDIILYNNADGDFNVTLPVKATVFYTGLVLWEPPVIYKSYCPINVEFFPFDQQECFMKFSSWTYDGLQIDLRHVWEKQPYAYIEQDAFIPMGIDLCDYTDNVEWDIINVTAVKRTKKYPCCDEIYPYILFNVTIRRKTLFYTINLILPIIAISTVTVLVFYLPSNSGEKITLSISILLALTVFFLLLSDISPPTSIVIPLIGKYLLFTLIMVTTSIFLTVYTLSIHFRSPSTHVMSPWVRRVFTEFLPKCLIMKRPQPRNRVLADVIASTDNEQRPVEKVLVRQSYSDVQRRAVASKYGEEAKKCMNSVILIAETLKKKDQERQEEKDWIYMAMVMDRLFLYIFTAACIFGTIGIFLNAPSIRDPRIPLSRHDFDCSQK